jgi:general secretion pathway protein L
MSVSNFVSDLMLWWPDELRKALGGRSSTTATKTDLIARIIRGGVELSPAPGAKAAFDPVLAAEPSDIGPTLKSAVPGRLGKPAVAVVIEPERYLKRRLSAIRLPRSRQIAMARLDLQSATPFNLADSFLLLPAYDSQITDSSYYTVRKSVLGPVIAALEAAGCSIASVSVADAGRALPADRLSLADIVGRTVGAGIARKALAIGTAVAAAGLIAVVGAAHWRYATAAAEIDARIEAADAQVRNLRKLLTDRDAKIAQIGAVRDEKKGTVPFVAIIEEMSRAIPDTTWLTEISVTGDMVRFAGFAESAAALIPILESSPLFSAPTFMEPVVRVVNQEGERFSIAMQIENVDG